MRDISIEMKDIKNFLCKKINSSGIITKRILGVTMRYVRGKKYKELISFLQYIQPFIPQNVDELINEFNEKQNLHDVSAKTYETDLIRFNNLIKDIEPSEFPPATGAFRALQLNILELAREVITDLEKNTDIKIWMDGGTLLGAIRHGGFIPWDDDMDFGVIRKDFNKLIEYFKSKYLYIDSSDWIYGKNFEANIKKIIEKYPNIIFGFRHPDSFKLVKGDINNFAILDFFAFDYYNDMHNVITLKNYSNSLKEKIGKYKTYKEVFNIQQEEFENGENVVSESDVISAGIDNWGFYWHSFKGLLRPTDIFPLKKLKFENVEFNAPCNHHVYLKSIYNFYNKLPSQGIGIGKHINSKDIKVGE